VSNGKPRIGYIGVGLMGKPMVDRLLDAGYPVTVWNRSREKLDPVVERGAVAAETPAALAAASDYVFMCLMDTAAVEAVVFGSDGVAHAKGPTVLVDFSTLPPETSRAFAARLKDANGMGWVDAPVSGGVPGAEKGTLAIMAGGDENDIETVRPVVMNLCARFTRMGGAGAGQSTKMCNQIISGCTMAVVAEAVGFALRSGVDASRLTEALSGGFADSIPFQLFAPRMAAQDFSNPLGATRTMIKDLDAVEDIAGAVAARVPMTESALSIMRYVAERGDADNDISTIIKYFVDGERKSTG
jgi:3-hydroxyisobutyrate dehydrogenase